NGGHCNRVSELCNAWRLNNSESELASSSDCCTQHANKVLLKASHRLARETTASFAHGMRMTPHFEEKPFKEY
ncbi:hypothetical protein, partial [Acidisoma silvae]|uniref:hypothetical protein n=1 Tax=Acidisoma silvae TaxID=2802396 RepID=UPI001D0B2FC8